MIKMIKQFIKNIFEGFGAKVQPVELEVPIKQRKSGFKPGKAKVAPKKKVAKK